MMTRIWRRHRDNDFAGGTAAAHFLALGRGSRTHNDQHRCTHNPGIHTVTIVVTVFELPVVAVRQ